ncbi:membrane protein [Burkholderiaceae bacterium 16]|nr:membrane protein [Burkholderiaceae bacterium 16]
MKRNYGLSLAAISMMAASAAHAQSSVTLYGVADVGIEYLSHAPSASGGKNLVRMSSGNLSTSRWGIRGVEDLGGGLKALFNLESGISLDTGANNNTSKLFDRASFVGLSSQYGTLTLGRQTTPIYDMSAQLDPMAIANRYSLFLSDAILAGRADNAVKYSARFGGLTTSALYSFGRTNNGEVPGNFRIDRNVGLSLLYETGPFSVGAVYDELQGLSLATQALKDRRLLVGGTYVFGPAKAFAGMRWFNGNAGTLSVNRSNLYWAGLKYTATPALTLTGAAYYTDAKNSGADPLMLVASADYTLSKRTDVYMTVGYVANRKGSQLGMNGYNALSGPAGNVQPGDNQTGAVMGIRHKF